MMQKKFMSIAFLVIVKVMNADLTPARQSGGDCGEWVVSQ